MTLDDGSIDMQSVALYKASSCRSQICYATLIKSAIEIHDRVYSIHAETTRLLVFGYFAVKQLINQADSYSINCSINSKRLVIDLEISPLTSYSQL